MNDRLLACALLCLLFSIPAHAAGEYRTVEVESLSISIDSEWSTQIAQGYWPVRFNIANLGGHSFTLNNTAAFGQPTSRAGQNFGSGGPRALQLGARVSF